MIKKNTKTPRSNTRSKHESKKKKIVTDIGFYFWSVWLFNLICGHSLGIKKKTLKHFLDLKICRALIKLLYLT